MPSDLGEFLRARRKQVAVPPGRRRRTPGMRREEVAAAANVSVDYYTRLEQGRESNPSDAVLDALGDALGFTADDRSHARALRSPRAPRAPAVTPAQSERMTRLVESVRPSPAYVLDRLSNVVAINAEAARLFDGILDEAATRAPNTCRYLVLHPRARQRFADWEQEARGSVAGLRAANAGQLESAGLAALVDELTAASSEFASWWGGHAVAVRRAESKRFRGDDGALTVLAYEVLRLPDEGLRMTIYVR